MFYTSERESKQVDDSEKQNKTKTKFCNSILLKMFLRSSSSKCRKWNIPKKP